MADITSVKQNQFYQNNQTLNKTKVLWTSTVTKGVFYFNVVSKFLNGKIKNDQPDSQQKSSQGEYPVSVGESGTQNCYRVQQHIERQNVHSVINFKYLFYN